jgi:hypothetical protein
MWRHRPYQPRHHRTFDTSCERHSDVMGDVECTHVPPGLMYRHTTVQMDTDGVLRRLRISFVLVSHDGRPEG